MTRQMFAWIAVAYVVLVGGYLTFASFFFKGRTRTGEDSDDHEIALSTARARERLAMERPQEPGRGVAVPPVLAPDAGAVRDETVGRDQYRTEARRRIRDLQPFTVRQRQALGLMKKEPK